MKHAVLLVLACGLWAGFGSSPAFAQQTASLPATASVALTLDLKVIVTQVYARTKGVDPWKGAWVVDTANGINQGMDFGTLKMDPKWHVWLSDWYFTAFLYASTNQGSYRISQQCSAPSSGIHDLIPNFIMCPDYQAVDRWIPDNPDTEQGDPPGGDHLEPGGARLAAGDHNIYISTTGRTRVVRCYYGLATGNTDSTNGFSVDPSNAQALNGDTPSGQYRGSVTFTLTLN